MFHHRFKSHHDAENSYRHLLKQRKSSKQELMEYLSTQVCQKRHNAIYVHIPFCDRICSFCNMNRQLKDETLDRYVEQLLGEIKEISNTMYLQSAPIEAIYFGGGTPTTLSPSQMEEILVALRTQFQLQDEVEISCETTLHNLTDAHLEVFQRQGVNRLSIGIQTFQGEGRKFFNRTYTKEEAAQRIAHIREDFKGCLSVDIIYNYPNETLEMLEDDAQMIVHLGIDSVSFYSLMVHEGSALSKQKGLVFSNQQDAQFHHALIQILQHSSDFVFLELTKLARPGRDAYRYMKIRNSNGNTIPLGRGAGGQIDQYSIYVMDFHRVMVSYQESRQFDLANQLYGMFQNTVINAQDLAPYGLSDQIAQLCEGGYLSEHGTQFQLTNQGIFYGNNIGGFLVKSYLEQENIS